MFDFDALNPAFEDREPYVEGYFEDEDGVFGLPNDYDEEFGVEEYEEDEGYYDEYDDASDAPPQYGFEYEDMAGEDW